MTPVGFPVLTVYAIYRLADEASKIAAIPDEPLTVERDLPAGRGMLTMDLSKAAAETLQRSEGRTVYLVDGYLRLPRVDRSQYPGEVMDEGNTRIKRWYNEDVTQIDYSGLRHEGLDVESRNRNARILGRDAFGGPHHKTGAWRGTEHDPHGFGETRTAARTVG